MYSPPRHQQQQQDHQSIINKPSFTLESGLSSDEIIEKSDSSSKIVWDEFECDEDIKSSSQAGEDNNNTVRVKNEYKAPGAVLKILNQSNENLDILCTSDDVGLIICVSSDKLKAKDVLEFYSPISKRNQHNGDVQQKSRRWSIGNNTEMTNKEKTDLLKKFLCETAKEKGSFSLVLFDAHSGRVCAARTAASPKLYFGFNSNKKTSGLCISTEENSMENVDFSILPSGRFIYGRQYVKPMEFTEFWSTARANRAAAPAKQSSPNTTTPASNNNNAQHLSGDSDNSTISKEDKIFTPENRGDYMKAIRYAPTGSRGDIRAVWTAGRGTSADINKEEAKKIALEVSRISEMSSALKKDLIDHKNGNEINLTRTRLAEERDLNDTTTHGPPLKKISIDRAYRPPSMRKQEIENKEIKLQERQLAESLGYSLTHALMRMSEDRLSGETMKSLTEFHAAIASKNKERKVQEMSSFFTSTAKIPSSAATAAEGDK